MYYIRKPADKKYNLCSPAILHVWSGTVKIDALDYTNLLHVWFKVVKYLVCKLTTCIIINKINSKNKQACVVKTFAEALKDIN